MSSELRVAALLLCLLVPSAVLAAPRSRGAAETLFVEGRVAMERGDYAKACPLLARSQELDPAGGTLLNLALCRERAGQLTAALDDWRQAAARAHADGRADREREALVHVADLEARVPHVSLVLAVDAPGSLQISVDGNVVATPTLSAPTALRLDPGPHTLRVELAGHVATTRTFELQERVPTTVPIELPTAADVAAEPVRVEFTLPTVASAANPPARPHARFSAPAKVLFGVAAASGITSAVTGILAVTASTAASACVPKREYCTDDQAIASGDRARTMAWVSTGTALVSVAALWTGLLLPRNVVLEPVVTARSGVLGVRVSY